MAITYLSQAYDMLASLSYDDTIANAETQAVAEGQTSLEGDMNVLRTIIKNLKNSAAWHDDPDMAVNDIAGKFFVFPRHESGFDNVSIAASSSTNAFDTAIKGITNHNNGAGNSTTEGVITSVTKDYNIEVRDHASQNPYDDGNGNQVYGKLTYDSGNSEYVISWYSVISGTETAYTFSTTEDVDISVVLTSTAFKDLPWDRFIDGSFHDLSGIVGSLTDDDVSVDGMLYLLNGMVTQAQINAKVDLLGHADTDGEGLELIAINDSATGGFNGFFTGTTAHDAIQELVNLLGSTTSGTFSFTENNVLTDNDPVYSALNKLDLKWGDLASTGAGEGANLVGIEDAAGHTTETTVEGAIAELYTLVDDAIAPTRRWMLTTSATPAGGSITVPNSLTYTPSAYGTNMHVFINGRLMTADDEDYEEASTTTITVNRPIRPGARVEFHIFK